MAEMRVFETLKAARSLITLPDNWVKCSYAYAADRKTVVVAESPLTAESRGERNGTFINCRKMLEPSTTFP